MPTQYGKLLSRAGDPEPYWALIMVPPPRGFSSVPRQPIVYVIATGTIFTRGLLFDVKPWLIGIGAALGFSALLWLPLVRGITGKKDATVRPCAPAVGNKRVESVRHVPNQLSVIGSNAPGVEQRPCIRPLRAVELKLPSTMSVVPRHECREP